MCLQLVKQIRSSTWGNNAKRGKCDPWTYFSYKMRCLIKPTSIWTHRDDKRGEGRGLRSVESRPSVESAGLAWRGRLGHLRKQPVSSPRGQAEGQAVVRRRSCCPSSRMRHAVREGWPSLSLPSSLGSSYTYRPRSEDRML